MRNDIVRVVASRLVVAKRADGGTGKIFACCDPYRTVLEAGHAPDRASEAPFGERYFVAEAVFSLGTFPDDEPIGMDPDDVVLWDVVSEGVEDLRADDFRRGGELGYVDGVELDDVAVAVLVQNLKPGGACAIRC